MANKVPIKSHPVQSWTLNGGKGGRLEGLLVSKKQDKAGRWRLARGDFSIRVAWA
jgi:hypothetical protein